MAKRTTKDAAGWTPTVIRQPNGHETTYFKCPNCSLVMVIPVDHECYQPGAPAASVGFVQVPDASERIRIQADTIAFLEAGVYGNGKPTDVYPDWVYEARTAMQHQNAPWLPDLLAILGWQGGTVHQALNAVKRLVAAEDERRHKAP